VGIRREKPYTSGNLLTRSSAIRPLLRGPGPVVVRLAHRLMASPPLTIYLFGPLRVTVRGKPLPRVRTRSVEWLLALLTLRHGRAASRSWLAGTLWPDSGEGRALQNLRQDLVRLRQALGPEAVRIQSPSRDTLALDLGAAEVDVLRFD